MNESAPSSAPGRQPPAKRPNWRVHAQLRRLCLALLVVGQTGLGVYVMVSVLPYHGGKLVEQGLIVLFTILFAWISVGFWIGLFGFVIRRLGGDSLSLMSRYPESALAGGVLGRTAVVMPIYHEPVSRTLGGLRAIYQTVEKTGQLEHFDFFILSDSRDPEYWLNEQAAWYRLCEELKAFGRLFYRRRTLNMHYKSGNIADFLRRWGRRYRYMIVLDADSLMEGETLVRMVRLMEREPQVGILQTNPTIVNGQSLFARVQQFANQAYGPLFSTGLAAIQLGEAAYWGHNAIIRVEAFMRHCGLRRLSGPGIFGGSISSHDFVEAAFMGRAGYEVWLEPELAYSHEESPPTLVDELTRDKRWAKGNLQHLWLLLFEPRLRLAHRMAFLNGILSYVASPLWLAFLLLATLETTQLVLWPINYFPDEPSLFPLWPEWRPEWALGLAGGTLFLLFFPKVLALLDILLSGRKREYGELGAVGRSILLEMLISALLAPIRMLAHSRYVIEALFNVTLRWAGQNRSEETGWLDAIVNQAPGTVLALFWAGFALWLDPMFFYWSLPVAVPLILAAPTSVLLSRIQLGQSFRRKGFFLTPEEVQGSRLLEQLDGHDLPQAHRAPQSAFVQAVLHPVLNKVHGAFARRHPQGAKRKRIEALRAHCLALGPTSLNRSEIALIAQHSETLEWLHRQAWCSSADQPWGKELDQGFRSSLSSRNW